MEERFKEFDELLTPDSRSRYREVGPASLEGFYRIMAELRLNATVPQDIQNHFVTARHLVVYSWFVYPFVMLAQSHAYGTLEYALRERLGRAKDERPPTLRALWDMAIKRRLLRDEGFRDWPRRHGAAPGAMPSTEWVRQIGESLAGLRNDLAHGSFSLYPEHWRLLPLVADAINQLYPESS
ncbi:MAG TPA: hypothetical protein VHG35_11115 [Gemmatimonadales bacterium]|nr:hypothetical protein [Gemmatimonadales bacterium]